MLQKVNVFWFRRDLRLNDNAGLFYALTSNKPVLPLFIFDTEILSKLERNDARVRFIYEELLKIEAELKRRGSSLLVRFGKPEEVWQKLINEFSIESVYFNHDYEPYAIRRDESVAKILRQSGIEIKSYKDHVIFEKNEVVKPDGNPISCLHPIAGNGWNGLNMTASRLFS
ncbi:MAG: deoxyribodipyrimidine photo-lyase [Bacteroidales bacterium]